MTGLEDIKSKAKTAKHFEEEYCTDRREDTASPAQHSKCPQGLTIALHNGFLLDSEVEEESFMKYYYIYEYGSDRRKQLSIWIQKYDFLNSTVSTHISHLGTRERER